MVGAYDQQKYDQQNNSFLKNLRNDSQYSNTAFNHWVSGHIITNLSLLRIDPSSLMSILTGKDLNRKRVSKLLSRN